MISQAAGTRSLLCVGIILTIGFQQFPVIRFGGSFRIYEFLSVLLFLAAIASGSLLRKREVWSCMFFVVAPLLSFALFWAGWINDVDGYYQRFGVAGQFRYGYFIATFVPLVYFFLCWVSFTEISESEWLFLNRETVIRWLILSGNAIGLFALLAATLNGWLSVQTPIQMLPEWLQNVGKASYGYRTYGFSQEPSFYVLYQGWVLLFTYFYRNLFSRVMGLYLVAVASLCLLMTMSSALIGFAGACVVASLITGAGKVRIKRTLLITLVAGAVVIAAAASGYGDLLYYAFYQKIVGFFSAPTTTLDSGQFRSYTASLGFQIFKDYPLTGVGPGASIFFMHSYEHLIPIAVYGETLNPGSFPQNSYVSVLSDLGAIGLLAMLLFMGYVLVTVWKAARLSAEVMPFLIGSIFTSASLLSVAPAYSMFIWIFPAFALCVARSVLSKNPR